MPENIIIFLKSKIENRKRKMGGGGDTRWETDLRLAPAARSKEFAVFPPWYYHIGAVPVTVSVIVYTSYHYDTYHSIYNILFRYIIKNENQDYKSVDPCCPAAL